MKKDEACSYVCPHRFHTSMFFNACDYTRATVIAFISHSQVFWFSC